MKNFIRINGIAAALIWCCGILLLLPGTMWGQCLNDNVVHNSTPITLACNASGTNSVGAGVYVQFNVTQGEVYNFNTCASGASPNFNTQLTGYNGTGVTSVFFNDDAGSCGASTNSNVTWTSKFTGTLRVLVDRSNCTQCGGVGGQVCSTYGSVVLSYQRLNAALQPSTISGPATLCPGTSGTYSVTNVPGTTYNWSLPAGWSGSSTTNSITVTAGSTSFSSASISVTATNACGTSAARSRTITEGCDIIFGTTGSGSRTVCTATIYDPGGASDYGNNQSYILTLYPATAGSAIRLDFTSFAIENAPCSSNYDWLRIYNGNSTAATEIGCYTSNTGSPGTVVSTAVDGSLTLYFKSDVSAVASGFVANVSCQSVPYRVEWISSSLGSSTWCAGESRNVTVTLKNTGTATWTNSGPDVNIGLKWNTNGANWADYYVRVDANNLAPGATQTYTFPITASNRTSTAGGYTTPLAAGTNNLTFDVVVEGNCWFATNSGSCGPGNTVYTSPNQTISAIPACATSPSPGNGASGTCLTGSVSWSAVSGATSYDVYFQANNSNPQFVTNTASTSYNYGTLSASTQYYWRIVPKNSCGSASGCSTWSFTTTSAIGAPTANAATSVSCGSFTANWGSVSGAVSYRLDVSTNSSFSSFVPGYSNLTVGGTFSSVTGLTSGVTYYYRVRAVNSCGNTSGQSNTITTTTAGPSNDACAGAINMNIGGAAVTGDIACANSGSGACSGSIDYDLWYRFTTLCAGDYQVYVNPSSSFDAVFQLYNSCGGSNLTPFTGSAGADACVDDGGNDSDEYATYSLGAGTYYVRVYEYNSSGSAYPATTTFTVEVDAVSLSIPGQPGTITGPASLCPGASGTYSVTNVSGATYTWTLPAGWSGSSTTNSINVTASSTVGAGTISVTAGNACGTSAARTKSVESGPVPIANAGADATKDCAGAITLAASSNPEIIMTEDFGNAHSELTNNSSAWRLYYLYGSHPQNRTEWWISNSANGYNCAIGGSSLAQFDTDSQYGPIKCDYAWDDGTTDEIAYNINEISALLYTHVYLDFDYIVSGEVSGSTVYDYMQVVYSIDGGSTWVSVNAGNNDGSYTVNNNRGVNNGYFSASPSLSHAHIELPSVLAGNKFLIGFRWYNDGATGYIPGMVVDNIVVSGEADYNWSGGTIAFGADTKNPVVTAPGTYTVTVTAGNGCTASDQMVVTQGSLSVDVDVDNALTCTSSATMAYTNPDGGDQTWVAAALSGATTGVTVHGNATYTGGRLRLTSATGSVNGAAFIDNANNFNSGQFDLDFDLYIGGGSGADGFSVSYGAGISSTPGGTESGVGTGLKICFDTYDNGTGGYQWSGNNTPGIFLVYNNTVLAHSAGTSWRGAWHRVNISVDASNNFTLEIDGNTLLSHNLGSSAYASANKTGWDVALGARTGGAFDEHSIKNLLLTVYNQYEYALSPTWSTNNTYNPVTPGNYTPGIRLAGGACTETYSSVEVTAPPTIDAVPTVDNTSPICLGNTVDLTPVGLAPSGKVLNVTGTNRMGGNMLTGSANNFTMEFWVKPTKTMNVGATEANTGISFALNNTELNLAIFPENGGGNAGAGVSVGTNGIAVVEHGSGYFPALLVHPMTINDWTHIAVVYTNRTPTLYVNGNFVKTGLQSSRTNVYPSTGTGQGYGYYNGELDNIRVWSSSRTSALLRSNMYLETPGSTSGLVAHYTFNNSNTNSVVGPNNSNSGCTFADAAFYTYTWSGTYAPTPANTTEVRTSGTITASGTHGISVVATAAGCASNGSSVSNVVADGPNAAAINSAVSPAPAIGANDYLWAGNTNTNWSDVTNWYVYNGSVFTTTTVVPATNRDVYIVNSGTTNCISVGNTATVNVTSNSNALYIGTGATLGFGSNQVLQVYGDYMNNGSLVNSGTSRVRFRGGSVQNVYSGGTGANKHFAILELNKTGGSVIPQGDIYIDYDLILTAGELNNSSNSSAIYLERHWTNTAGTYVPGTGTVHLVGTGTQNIKSLWTSGTNNSFYNLTINKTGSNSAVLTENANILNLTNVLDGKLNIQTFTGNSETVNVANGAEIEIGVGGRLNVND